MTSSSEYHVSVFLSPSRWSRPLHTRQPARYGPGTGLPAFRGAGSPRGCRGARAGMVLFPRRAFRDHLLSLCGRSEAPSRRGLSHGGQRRRRGNRLGVERCLMLWGPTRSCKMPDALGTNLELKDVWGSGDRLGAERCLGLQGPIGADRCLMLWGPTRS